MNKLSLIILLCAMSAGLCVGSPALAQSDTDEARMQAMQREADNDVKKRGQQKHIELLSKQFQLPGSEIEKLRGVDATPTLKTLLDRGLIKIAGHQETPGQPAIYATTDEFLSIFGLSSLKELPTLRDLRELDQDPGESEDELEPSASVENSPESQTH